MIAAGDDLTTYISNDIMELKNVDVMLNLLGVHHLHLGERVEQEGKSRGFIGRTKSLLFCYFTDTEAYSIDVMDHDSFGSQSVIEIVHENWPVLLDGFRIPDVTPYVPLSGEQTFDLTRAGYSTFVTTRDGTVYMPPGGGVMWSGENAIDIMKTNQLLNRLHHMQTSIIQFIEIAFCRNSGALMRKSGRENKRTDLSLWYFVGYAVRASVAPHSARIRSLMRRR